jgi:4-amino-4-deoxy-L-arabinose transferase-like glycosyltransferase
MNLSKRQSLALLAGATVALTIIRILTADNLPISSDEAYYWQWSKYLSLSYPDHPPMAAWLINIGTSAAGDTLTGVRFFSLMFSGLAGFIIFFTAIFADMRPYRALQAALLSLILPAPAAGALIFTPDVPLSFFLLLLVMTITRLSQTGQKQLWYIAAVPAGLACLSKLSGFLGFPLVLLAALLNPDLRSHLKTVHPWQALMLAMLITAPWLLTGVNSGFPSILHQSAHLAGSLAGTHVSFFLFPLRWLELLSGQFALLTPPAFIFTLLLLINFKRIPFSLFPAALGFILPLSATLLTAFTTHPEQNWASTGHPLAAILAVSYLTNTNLKNRINKTLWLFLTALFFTITIIPMPSNLFYRFQPKQTQCLDCTAGKVLMNTADFLIKLNQQSVIITDLQHR